MLAQHRRAETVSILWVAMLDETAIMVTSEISFCCLQFIAFTVLTRHSASQKILLQQSPKKISLKTSNEWKSNFMQVWFNVPLNTLYRVAQIKIPHRTKCNFSTTVRFVHPNFLVYIGEILLQLWNFKKIILVFSKVMAVYIFYAIFSILHGIIDSNLWFLLSRNIDCYYKY